MKTRENRKVRRSCEFSEEENEFPGDSPTADVTTLGKYRCRVCGLIFETLAAHDAHRLKVHSNAKAYLNAMSQP